MQKKSQRVNAGYVGVCGACGLPFLEQFDQDVLHLLKPTVQPPYQINQHDDGWRIFQHTNYEFLHGCC